MTRESAIKLITRLLNAERKRVEAMQRNGRSGLMNLLAVTKSTRSLFEALTGSEATNEDVEALLGDR